MKRVALVLGITAWVASVRAAAPVAVWQDQMGDRFPDRHISIEVGSDGLPVVAANVVYRGEARPKGYPDLTYRGSLIKYGHEGARLWEVRAKGEGSAVLTIKGCDGHDQIILTVVATDEVSFAGQLLCRSGQSSNVVLKMSATGELISVMNGVRGDVHCVGNDGGLHTLEVTGGRSREGVPPSADPTRQRVIVRSYNSDSELLWATQLADAEPRISEAEGYEWRETEVQSALATDASGNVFAVLAESRSRLRGAGSSTVANVGTVNLRVALMKLDANGAGVWRKTFLAEDSVSCAPGPLIAVGDGGKIYVTGSGRNLTFNEEPFRTRWEDVFVAKFDSTGSCEWVRRGGGPNRDYPNSLTIDPAGNIYIGGGSQCYEDIAFGQHRFRSVPHGHAMWIIKLAPRGEFTWLKVFDGPNRVELTGIGTGFNGRSYLAGWCGGHYPGEGFKTEAGRLTAVRSEMTTHPIIGSRGKTPVKAITPGGDLFVIALEE